MLSTIEVWSMHAPRTEIRSKAEAIAETGERYHKILLTPEQVYIEWLYLWFWYHSETFDVGRPA